MKQPVKSNDVYLKIRQILEAARATAARSVNTAQVVAHWLIGQEIVEEEQKGAKRADYGKQLLEGLSKQLAAEFRGGYSVQNLRFIRQFYLAYPQLLGTATIRYALRSEFKDLSTVVPVVAPPDWQPGSLHPNLSWTHYRTLLRVDKVEARAFYEIEAVKNNWSARELERQINSLLYERLALSKDKKGLMRLATKGQEIQQPVDVFKDPVVIEFLGLPESSRLVESRLEQALIDNLQSFLLELGKGFAFVSRQERLTLDGDHFYIDLVFYHAVLFDELIRCKVNIFNISKINSEVRGGKSPRIKRLSEYIGESYFDYLAGLEDLVLLMDESHRYRASAGVRAINELKSEAVLDRGHVMAEALAMFVSRGTFATISAPIAWQRETRSERTLQNREP